MESSNALIELGNHDNILIAKRRILEGEWLSISGLKVQMRQTIELGFKIASKVIKDGEKIIKCDVPIGSATRDIAVGELVHVHNMKSDYVPTYTIEKH